MGCHARPRGEGGSHKAPHGGPIEPHFGHKVYEDHATTPSIRVVVFEAAPLEVDDCKRPMVAVAVDGHDHQVHVKDACLLRPPPDVRVAVALGLLCKLRIEVGHHEVAPERVRIRVRVLADLAFEQQLEEEVDHLVVQPRQRPQRAHAMARHWDALELHKFL